MDSIQEHSLWPYWPSVLPDSYLLEEEPLLAGLSFPSFYNQPLCSTITQSNVLQGEFDAIFEDDVLRFWDSMEQSEINREDSDKGLPLLCHNQKGSASSNTSTRADRVGSGDKVLSFDLLALEAGEASKYN